jgi:hypothetical protein
LPEEESEEDEEKEEDLEAEQTQGSSSLSTENLGEGLHQEGKDFGWERCLRWRIEMGVKNE